MLKQFEGWGILIDRWYRCASKTKGIFGNFSSPRCYSHSSTAAVPVPWRLACQCFQSTKRPASESEQSRNPTASLGHEIMVKLWNFQAHREMIDWTPATWSLGIFIPPKPSRMIRVWKIKISYQRSLTQVRKPEVESKWRAALGV